MGALEMHQRLEQLKRSIHRVHLYSQGEAQPLPGSSNPANLTHVPLSLVLCLKSIKKKKKRLFLKSLL